MMAIKDVQIWILTAFSLVPSKDLIVSKDHKSAIGTLVESSTRYCLFVQLEEKDAESVRKAFAKMIKELPRDLTKTLTYDRGKEMT